MIFFKREEEPEFSEEDLEFLGRFNKFLSRENMKRLEELKLSQTISFRDEKIVMKLFGVKIIPQIKTLDKEMKGFVDECNARVKREIQNILFERFAEEAHEKIPDLIAPHIIGYEEVKGALALQLFAKEPVHILLLGDPGTGKTDLIREATELAPLSTFGLGSGTTGVGLVGTYKGFEFVPGLLPQAHNGICALDELNLLKEESRAGLYNAMEKGFVTYDKAGVHQRMESHVSIVATANPKGDSFESKDLKEIKKQVPFDPALMTRFHVVFLMNKPSQLQFENITKAITSNEGDEITPGDKQFIQHYITLAKKKTVHFPKEYETDVVTYIQQLKQKENMLLTEITPRTVVGFMNMVKASARMNLRSRVEKVDIDRVKLIFEHALHIPFENIKSEKTPIRNVPRGYQ